MVRAHTENHSKYAKKGSSPIGGLRTQFLQGRDIIGSPKKQIDIREPITGIYKDFAVTTTSGGAATSPLKPGQRCAGELKQQRVNSPASLPPLYCAFSATESERRAGCLAEGSSDPNRDELPAADDATSHSVSDSQLQQVLSYLSHVEERRSIIETMMMQLGIFWQ
ncbi:hypothetical protein FRB96_000728 [Tulasnella sp. 330]|nr:hypothetical protein FRB96_000728 [Tulasnella sp. 330]